MGTDVIQDSIGSIGRWQVEITLLMALLKLPIAWFQLSILVLEARPKHFWCADPLMNDTKDSCNVQVNNETVPCRKWEFAGGDFTNTIVSEWQLTCGRLWITDMVQATFMLGVLLGNVIFGIAADRHGRRRPLLVAIAAQGIVGVATSFVPWLSLFVVLRFILALATGGTMITSFVLVPYNFIVMEVVGSSWRPTMSIVYQVCFPLGICFMSGIAYILRDWRDFHLALGCLSLVFLIYSWIIPESPLWLLAVGRRHDAVNVLMKGALRNGKDVEAVKRAVEYHEQHKQSQTKNLGNVLDLLKTPRLRINTLALFFNWSMAGLAFFGMSQNLGALGGNLFVNMTVAGMIGLPGTLSAMYFLRFGRRKSILSSQILAGIPCLLLLAVPIGTFPWDWPRLALSSLAIIALSLYMPALYLYSGELLPTVVRNAGMGTASMCARIGSIVAPFVKSLGEPWSITVFGIAPLAAAVLLSLLPETRNCPLPETLEDGEKFGQHREEDKRNCNYLRVPMNTIEPEDGEG